MCCRYYMEMSPELRPIVEAAKHSRLYENNAGRLPKGLTEEGEVFPESLVPVFASNRSGQPAVFPMIWGYHSRGLARTIVNARTESASRKEMFRDSWVSHRCVIPASWYFEWKHELSPSGKKKAGTKFAIRPGNQTLTYLCGLYRLENDFPHFVVLTREPGDSVRFIHDRMPLILPERAVRDWISPNSDPDRLVAASLTDMVFEVDENAFRNRK